jgi:phytoene dehydrogenase-like protein
VRGDADVLVIGSGLDGLVAACTLARRGFRVTVVEAHPRRPGGALATEEGTRAGFAHDVVPLVCPLLHTPALYDLELGAVGLRLQAAPFDTCHLADDGSYAATSPDPDLSAAHFGAVQDGARWRELAGLHGRLCPRLQEVLLGAVPLLGALRALRPRELWHCALLAARGPGAAWRRWFTTAAARDIVPAFAVQAAHSGRTPSAAGDRQSAYFGYLLAAQASTSGFPFPVGGAQGLTNALVTRLERHGGQLLLGATVDRICVAQGRAQALRLRDGRELVARRGILVGIPRAQLVSDLLRDYTWPSRSVRAVREAPVARLHVDFALAAPVPWSCATARNSAVVFAGDFVAGLLAARNSIRANAVWPARAFTVTQHSLFDATRAPPHQHAISCQTIVPSNVEGGWARHVDSFADQLEERMELLAPGFRARILARRAHAPGSAERPDQETVPSDPHVRRGREHSPRDTARVGWQKTLANPSSHTTPIRGLFVASSDGAPGLGVHGMCGYHAALRAARDLG